MSVQASLKLCFVSVCMGLTAKAEEEAAFGADAGLGTATSGGGLLDVPDPVAFVGPPPPPPPPPPRNGMGEDKYKAVHCTKNVDTSVTTKTGEFDLKTWYSQVRGHDCDEHFIRVTACDICVTRSCVL